jgi:pimeloyl-ACP methyl ester carboxylesterase
MKRLRHHHERIAPEILLQHNSDSMALKKSSGFHNGTFYVLDGLSPGEKVVMIHGIGSFHGHFDCLSSSLAQCGYYVLRYDLIGRGSSESNSSLCYNADTHLNQLRSLLQHLGFSTEKGRYHIIGHSMGGALACLYSDKYINEILSLTLLAPAGLLKSTRLAVLPMLTCFHSKIKKSLSARRKRSCLREFKNPSSPESQEWTRRLCNLYVNHKTIEDAVLQSLLQFPLSGMNSTIIRLSTNPNLSVLLMHGDSDRTGNLLPSFQQWKSIFRSPTAKLKRFEYWIVSDTAHNFFMEKTGETSQRLVNFLQNVSAAAS